MSLSFIDDRGSLRPGWKTLGFILLVLSLGDLLALVRSTTGLAWLRGPWAGALVGVGASLLCVRLEGRSFSSLGFLPGTRWLKDCALGALSGLALALIIAMLVRGMDGFHWQRAPAVGTRQLLAGAWLLLGVSLSEEILFRGFPFQRLVEGLGPWVGQLTCAALFTWVHWANPGMQGATRAWASMNISLLGILLGFCYLRTRSLALPVGLHFGWNWAQGSLLGFGVSGTTEFKGAWTPVFHGRPEWLTGGSFGLEASLPCALVCSVAVLAMWRWKGRPASGTRAE